MNDKTQVFLCVSGKDLATIRGTKDLFYNPDFHVEYYDEIDRMSLHNPEAEYAKRVIQAKIRRCDLIVCLVGEATYKSEWVLWILARSKEEGKKTIFMAMQGVLQAKLDLLTNDPDVVFYPWDLERLAELINYA